MVDGIVEKISPCPLDGSVGVLQRETSKYALVRIELWRVCCEQGHSNLFYETADLAIQDWNGEKLKKQQ